MSLSSHLLHTKQDINIHTVRTYTVIGTPHYMAPEVILGQGYSVSVDYWSLGIILYEFLFGMVPFGENYDDPTEIYQEIVQYDNNLSFPDFDNP
jgi:cGMP-dependent protein kinase